jgi:sugar lactone lactonase YvrE
MSVRILATRGTESQIQSVSSASQSEGQIAYATDTKDFYVSDGTQFNKIGKDELSQFGEISVVNEVSSWHLSRTNKLDINPPEANPSGITFKPDGTKAFVLGYSRNRVQMYDLSTAWDLTSAGSATESEYLVQNNLSSTQEDFFIDSSGTRMYVLSRSSDSIGQFTLNTAWDISDITFVQDLHINSTSLSGGVTGIVTGEPDPAGLTFKPDGTILYLVGYNRDRVHQIPLSTAWDISTHGTITELSLSPANASQAIQFSLDGKEMYILDYSLDGIAHFTLSTAWDVTTANLNTLSVAFIGIDEATPTGLYYRDDLGKCFIVGRSSDFAREVIANDIYSFNEGITAPVVYSPQINADKLTTGGGDGGSNNFYNTTYARSIFQTSATTYLGYDTGPKNVRIGNTVYGNYRFHVFQFNYIDSTFINAPTTTLPNIRFFNPLIGGVGVFSIGKTHNTDSNYLLGGVTDIESEADTFDHKGEITLGGELKVSGTKPLAYKDPNLYTSGTQIVLDNFTEASDTDLLNHTPDTGSGYTQVYISSGVNNSLDYAKISGGNGYVGPARNNSNDGFRFTNDTTISTANYEARAVIKRQSASDDPFVLFVKYIDEDNYFAMHFAGNYSYCTPMSVVNGVHTNHGALYYYANTSTADNVNFEVALRVVGNNVHLFYEGRYRGSREVNITGAGKAGIGFGRSNDSIFTSYDLTTSAQISKFEVYELPDSLFDGSDSVHYIENGKLGIGTTNPIEKLHVQDIGTSGVTGSMLFKNDNNDYTHLYVQSNGYGFRLSAHAASKNGYIAGDGALNFAANKSSGGSYAWFGNGSLFKVMNPDDGYSTPFVLNHNNRVGIGTTSPVGILHAYSTSAAVFESPSNAAIIIRRNDNVGYSSLLKYHSGNSEKFVAGLSDSGDFTNSTGEEYFIGTTKTNPLVVLKNDGKLGIGTTTPSTKFHVDGNIRVGDVNDVMFTNKLYGISTGDLTLYTSGNTLLTQTGNVGIGTTSPSEKLEVSGNIKVDKLIGNNANFDIYAQYTNRGRITLHSSSSSADSTVHTSFLTNGATRMVITRGGSTGIGTTSPHATALLEVASTTKGVLFPRMTEEQRSAIEEPATGLIVYQTDGTEGLYIYKSTGWTQII